MAVCEIHITYKGKVKGHFSDDGRLDRLSGEVFWQELDISGLKTCQYSKISEPDKFISESKEPHY